MPTYINLYYQDYKARALHVGFGPLRAELFAMQAMILDGYDISDIVQAWVHEDANSLT